jgi:hypothetical protein
MLICELLTIDSLVRDEYASYSVVEIEQEIDCVTDDCLTLLTHVRNGRDMLLSLLQTGDV